MVFSSTTVPHLTQKPFPAAVSYSMTVPPQSVHIVLLDICDVNSHVTSLSNTSFYSDELHNQVYLINDQKMGSRNPLAGVSNRSKMRWHQDSVVRPRCPRELAQDTSREFTPSRKLTFRSVAPQLWPSEHQFLGQVRASHRRSQISVIGNH